MAAPSISFFGLLRLYLGLWWSCCRGRIFGMRIIFDQSCPHYRELPGAGVGTRDRLRSRPAEYLDRRSASADRNTAQLIKSCLIRLPPPLESASLAYENPAFLNSPDGRIIRIMAEYSEPLARFRRERIQDTVVFFGSARFRALDVPTTSSNCWTILARAACARSRAASQRTGETRTEEPPAS